MLSIFVPSKTTNMKTILIGLLLVCCTFRPYAQTAWTDQSRILPDQLRNLPTAIFMGHSPSPVYPALNLLAAYPGKYSWKHETEAMAKMNLEVVAAGSYLWLGAKGWVANMKLDKSDFAKLFHCKNGRLKKNKTYTFVQNYRYGDQLSAGDALWFVIAKDQNGQHYKGIALVETESKLTSN
jgi:hypothetical protein